MSTGPRIHCNGGLSVTSKRPEVVGLNLDDDQPHPGFQKEFEADRRKYSQAGILDNLFAGALRPGSR
jgi:hypothetical protein